MYIAAQKMYTNVYELYPTHVLIAYSCILLKLGVLVR